MSIDDLLPLDLQIIGLLVHCKMTISDTAFTLGRGQGTIKARCKKIYGKIQINSKTNYRHIFTKFDDDLFEFSKFAAAAALLCSNTVKQSGFLERNFKKI